MTGHDVRDTGMPVEIDEFVAPRVMEQADTPNDQPTHTAAARGAPSRMQLLARTLPAPSSEECVPDAPVDTPIIVTPHFHLASDLGDEGRVVSAPPKADQTFAESEVTERATFLSGALPTYPEDALADGVELDTPLVFEVVVDTSGVVVEARAENHAGYGFDEAARTALRNYRFKPAKREGETVRVRMRWTVEFHLR